MGLFDLFKRKGKKDKTKKMFIPKHDDICVMGGWIFGISIFIVDEVLKPDAFDDEPLIIKCKYVAHPIPKAYKHEQQLYILSKNETLTIDCDFRRIIRLANAETKKFILDGIEEQNKCSKLK